MFRSSHLLMAVFAAAFGLASSLGAACLGEAGAAKMSPTALFESAAIHSNDLQTQADTLDMYARRPMDYSTESTSATLLRVRNLTDRIGEDVCALQALRSQVNPQHQARIDAMAANLRMVASSASAAITHFNERVSMASLYNADYQESVDALYAGVKAFRQGVTTTASDITD